MNALAKVGGRKFVAFLLLLATLVLFVLTGHLKDQEQIARLFLGLLGLYAGANVVQKGVAAVSSAITAKGPTS